MHKMIQKITKTVVTIFAGISLSFVGLKQEIWREILQPIEDVEWF